MNATLSPSSIPPLTESRATLWHVAKIAKQHPDRTAAAGYLENMCLLEVPQKIKTAFPETIGYILAGELPVRIFTKIPSAVASENFHKFGPSVVDVVRGIFQRAGIAWK